MTKTDLGGAATHRADVVIFASGHEGNGLYSHLALLNEAHSEVRGISSKKNIMKGGVVPFFVRIIVLSKTGST